MLDTPLTRRQNEPRVSSRIHGVGLPTSVGGLVSLLTACLAASPPAQPQPDVHSAEISPSRCVAFADAPLDPGLDGLARPAAPRCCESSYGFDPTLAARSCNFTAYLGESEELACVHRFADARGHVHELRITPMFGLDLDAAIALHESGEFDGDHTAGWLPERTDAWLSSTAQHSWALVGGWPTPRRLSWRAEACDDASMQAVVVAMSEAAIDEAMVSPLPRFELPERAPLELPDDSLLRRLAALPSTDEAHPLPHAGAALVEAFLAAAARSEDALAYLSPDARWGLPDRRQLGARPVADDGGVTLTDALRRAAARLPAHARVHCPALDRRVEPLVRRGEAAMWCVVASDDRLDLLVFQLRGQLREHQPDARIDYVGVFPQAPRHALRVPGEPPAPPMRLPPQLACGDPHVIDYPGTCADEPLEIEDDDESDDGSAAIDEHSPAAIEQLDDELDVPGIADLDGQ